MGVPNLAPKLPTHPIGYSFGNLYLCGLPLFRKLEDNDIEELRVNYPTLRIRYVMGLEKDRFLIKS